MKKNKNASNFKLQFLKAILRNVHNDDYSDDNTRDGFDVEMESKVAMTKRKVSSLILTKINPRYKIVLNELHVINSHYSCGDSVSLSPLLFQCI
jgi:hypothetical protein